MSVSKIVWNGIKKRLQSMALGITGSAIRICEIPEGSKDLGFTSGEGDIYLSFTHKIIEEIPDDQKKIMFVKGVFTHELMHKIATDFKSHKKVLAKLDKYEAKIFHKIFNIMEDAAIEYQAPAYIGGHLLKALNYMAMHLYKLSKPLEEYKYSPYFQFSSALIQYGDGGVLKGDFTFPEARETFYKVVRIFNAAMAETNGKKRIQHAYDAFLMAKPLWEQELKDMKHKEEFLERMAEWMREHGLTSHEGGGSPLDVEGDMEKAGSSVKRKEKRRKITFRKISKEEMERLRSEAGEGGGYDDGESDIEILYTDETVEKSDKSKEMPGVSSPAFAGDKSREHDEKACERSDAASDAASEDAKFGDEKYSETEKAPGAPSDGAGDEKMTGDASRKKDEKPDSRSSEDFETDPAGGRSSEDALIEDPITEGEYEITPEDIERIKSEIEEIKAESTSEKETADINHKASLDIPEMSETHKGITCKNIRVTKTDSYDLADLYSRLLEPMVPFIKNLANTLDRIFRNEAADREYRGSGRLNVKRLQSGRLTTRVFDRKKDPANRSDCCVLFLVDESASMRFEKRYLCAMQCVIGLTEVFSKLHIPVAVIGFTADTLGHDVVHYHYMHWLNTPAERLNLMNIAARVENFDGYSVRYAAKTIAKRPERHKFLIVLSDGAPACQYYYHGHDGVQDTINAIREAKRTADVIGVAIGNSDTKTIYSIYGNDFVHVSKPEDLFTSLGKVIKEKVKRWE